MAGTLTLHTNVLDKVAELPTNTNGLGNVYQRTRNLNAVKRKS
jgi:hypothetical protein